MKFQDRFISLFASKASDKLPKMITNKIYPHRKMYKIDRIFSRFRVSDILKDNFPIFAKHKRLRIHK